MTQWRFVPMSIEFYRQSNAKTPSYGDGIGSGRHYREIKQRGQVIYDPYTCTGNGYPIYGIDSGDGFNGPYMMHYRAKEEPTP